MERHIPVLLPEVASRLVTKPSGIYVDGTVGSAGHSEYLLKNFSDIQIIALDEDEDALKRARKNLKDYGSRFQVIKSNFRDIKKVLKQLGIAKVFGVLLDLGVSSEQLQSPERGFSYRYNGPLDMRFDQKQLLTAEEIINKYSFRELEEIFQKFGQEQFSRRVAREIVRQRQSQPLNSTRQLAEIIENAIPRYKRKFHPARRIFQALRIFVNNELESLQQFLEVLPDILLTGARAVIISYHSGEDRLVKLSFRAGVQNNIYRIIPPFLVRPTAEEIENNPRSRSARLRTIERR